MCTCNILFLISVDVYKIRLLHDELLDTLCKIIESEAFRAKCKNLLLALPGIENMDTEEIMNALHRRGDIGIGDYQKLKEMLDEECNQHIKFTEDAIVNSGGKVYRRGGSGELVEDCSPSRGTYQYRKFVLYCRFVDSKLYTKTRIEPVGKPYREVCLQTLL